MFTPVAAGLSCPKDTDSVNCSTTGYPLFLVTKFTNATNYPTPYAVKSYEIFDFEFITVLIDLINTVINTEPMGGKNNLWNDFD